MLDPIFGILSFHSFVDTNPCDKHFHKFDDILILIYHITKKKLDIMKLP